MKKYGLIIVFIIVSCAQEESEKVRVSFFDSNNGKIWYYGYTYEQFTNEDYIQFINNNSSQGSTFLNVCEVIAGKSFSRKLNWGDNFNIYENGCENNYVELVRSTEDELVYRSTYYAGRVHDLTCAEMELQDLPTNPQLITWSVKNNVMTVEHENEQSISTILTLVDEFDPGCFD